MVQSDTVTDTQQIVEMDAPGENCLSAKLLEQLGDQVGGAAVVLPARGASGPVKTVSTTDGGCRAKRSKREQRKIEKLKTERATREKRADVMRSLQSRVLPPEQARLLLSTGKHLGREKLSRRELVNRQFKLERAGILVDVDEHEPEMQAEVVNSVGQPVSTPDFDVSFNVRSVSGKKRRKRTVLLEKVSIEPTLTAETSDAAIAEEKDNGAMAPDDRDDDALVKRKIPTREHSETEEEQVATEIMPPFNRTPIHVLRDPHVQALRAELPVCSEEQIIMEAIASHSFCILTAETGSGKSTQLPQFLYEAGYSSEKTMIAITQPRRVAAVSVSKRVAFELGEEHGKYVAHQVRYDSSLRGDGSDRIVFMTDGILLREVQSDFLLRRYSVIVLDESHERGVNTDVLIGLLSRIVPLRNRKAAAGESIAPLRVVIMSATLRIDDFAGNQRLFPNVQPAVLHIPARQHPVTNHFSKTTELNDYINAVYKKVVRIHQRLPDGAILVFLTGKQEIDRLCSMIRRRFRKQVTPVIQPKRSSMVIESEDHIFAGSAESIELDASVLDGESSRIDDSALVDNEGNVDELDTEDDDESTMRVCVMPLYAMLDPVRQLAVFEHAASNIEGERLIIVATNVAETAITIPNVRYVVDCGREKVRRFDALTGIASYEIQWISQASAAQRSGRAGRTGPGHCYRLYSSAVFNDQFPLHSEPLMLQMPVDGLIMQLMAVGIRRVARFPFPTPPRPHDVRIALSRLLRLGAIEPCGSTLDAMKTEHERAFRLTSLGRTMSLLPVAPRFAKMLALADQMNCRPYMIAIVASLSVENLLLSPDSTQRHCNDSDHSDNDDEHTAAKQMVDEEEQRQQDAMWKDSRSDLLSMLNLVFLYDEHTSNGGAEGVFCTRFNIRLRAIHEVNQLRVQLSRTLNRSLSPSQHLDAKTLVKPTRIQQTVLFQLILSGSIDHIARLCPPELLQTIDPELRPRGFLYQSVREDAELFAISRRSLVFAPRQRPPEFIVFEELVRIEMQMARGRHRVIARMVTAIDEGAYDQLFALAQSSCHISAVLDHPAPRYDQSSDSMKCSVQVWFGPHRWPIGVHNVDLASHATPLDTYKWFGRALLQGDVMQSFKSLRPFLVVRPSALTVDLITHPAARLLVEQLEHRQCSSRRKLKKILMKDANYLREHLMSLLQQGGRDLFEWQLY